MCSHSSIHQISVFWTNAILESIASSILLRRWDFLPFPRLANTPLAAVWWGCLVETHCRVQWITQQCIITRHVLLSGQLVLVSQEATCLTDVVKQAHQQLVCIMLLIAFKDWIHLPAKHMKTSVYIINPMEQGWKENVEVKQRAT